LFAQGHTDESLVNFSLDLTNPSTIYEQEKIQLWSDRVRLATEMQNGNLVSSDWIYDNVFGMSEDEVEEQRDAVVRDKKRLFRLQAIERGEDPANATGTQGQPGEAVPGEEQHGKEKPAGVDLSGLPSEGVEEESVIADAKVGRPREGNRLGTDRHYLGRDPFGRKENQKALHRDPEGGELSRRRKGLARESLELKNFVKSLSKKFGTVKKNGGQMIAENAKSSYMDEKVLNDVEN